MKKVLSSLLVIFMLFGVVGCGNKDIEPIEQSNTNNEIQKEENEIMSTEEIEKTEEVEEVEEVEKEEIKDIEEDTTEKEFVEMKHSTTNVSKLIDSLYESEPKNVIVSDTSLNMALGMAMQGASGEGLVALENYFGSTKNDYGNYTSSLLECYSNDKDITLDLFNGVYVNDGIETYETFDNDVEKYFNADKEVLDFNNSNSAKVINNKCDEITRGMITEIVQEDELKDLEAVLLNALYFNGDWEDPFEEYNVFNEDFNSVKGVKEVETMHGGEAGVYYENDYATAFAKPYKGYNISFIGILPKESIVDENYDFNVSDIDIDSLLETRTEEYDVYYTLPKFKIEDKNELTDVLKENGLGVLFSDEIPCLENLSKTPLKFDKVVQKTVVDVNETGTEASAVTALEVCKMSALPQELEIREVYLNRPFVFMIYDNDNKEVLFMGKIIDL